MKRLTILLIIFILITNCKNKKVVHQPLSATPINLVLLPLPTTTPILTEFPLGSNSAIKRDNVKRISILYNINKVDGLPLIFKDTFYINHLTYLGEYSFLGHLNHLAIIQDRDYIVSFDILPDHDLQVIATIPWSDEDSPQIIIGRIYDNDILQIIDVSNRVYSLDITDEGQFIVYSVANEGQYLYQISTKANILLTNEFSQNLKFNPVKKQLVYGESAGITIYNIETSESVTLPDSKYYGGNFQFSPNGRFLVSWGGENPVLLWDLSDYTLVNKVDTLGVVTNVSFHKDSNFIAFSSLNGIISIFDLSNLTSVITLCCHIGYLYGIDFSYAGNLLVSGANDGTIKIWEWSTQTKLVEFQTNSGLISVSFGPKDILLIITGLKGTELWGIPN